MKIIKSITAIVSIGTLASCSTMQNKNNLATWQPEINQPIRQLEEQLAKLEQQQPMNYTISNIAFLYDAKLYIQFRKLLDTVSDVQQKELIKEQEKWLLKRKEETAKAYEKYKGGTLAPYNSAQMFIDITKKRIQEIEKQLNKTQ